MTDTSDNDTRETPQTDANGEQGTVPKSITIETLFGEKEFDWDRAIYMPTGLTGFQDRNVFALANFPDDVTSSFKLLQCLSEPELAFVVAPYNIDSDVIDRKHIAEVLMTLGIPEEHLVVLLIVTLHQPEDKDGQITMSVNLRAPIFIDSNRQVGWQHILRYPQYEYRKMISNEK